MATVKLTTFPPEGHAAIDAILGERDLTQTSLKVVRQELEKRLNLAPGGLDGCREQVKEIVTAKIQALQAANEAAAPPAPAPAAPPAAAAAEAEAEAEAVEASPEAGSVQTPPSQGQKRKAADQAESSAPKKGKGKGSKEKQKGLMTRKDFMNVAQAVTATVAGKQIKIPPKLFSTGSCGFWAGQKITMEVGGQQLALQCQFNFAVIGSKEWAD